MTLSFRETPDKIFVYLTDEAILGEAGIQETGKGLFDICKQAATSGKRLVIEFGGVQFMSSAMIRNLVLLNKFAKQNSVDLRVANIGPNILEVFKITRLNRVFRMDDDDPDFLGLGVPLPKPPSTLDGRTGPP